MNVLNKYHTSTLFIILLLLASVFIAGCTEFSSGTTEVQTESPPENVAETHNNGNLSSEEIRELERLVFEKTNKIRATRGRDKLTWNEELARVSDYHAWNMAEKDFKSHIGPDGDSPVHRLKQFGYNCDSNDLEEVIAIVMYRDKYSVSDISDRTIQLWMESDAHRAGVLSRGGRLAGVGAYNHASGEIFIVQLFCADVEPLQGSQDPSSDVRDRDSKYRPCLDARESAVRRLSN